MNDFMPSIKVTLYLGADEVDLDVVTQRLGIVPTETRTKDSFPLQSIITGFAKNIWSIGIIEENCIAVSIPFERMLEILKGKEAQINGLRNEYGFDASFVVVIHMKDGDSPEVVLPREVITFTAAIDAEIGFDLYCYE